MKTCKSGRCHRNANLRVEGHQALGTAGHASRHRLP
jgi:hypothetical protein